MPGAYFAVCTTMAGEAVASPDTCLTPSGTGVDVPTTYTNTGMLASTVGTSPTVLAAGRDIVTEGCTIASSSGDEAGTSLGTASGTIMSSVSFKTTSSKVYAKGKKVVVQTATTGQNGTNAVGTVTSPSQTKVQAAL